MSTIRIETMPFQRSHSRAPRGEGMWAFAFGTESSEPFFASGTFAEARRAAEIEARRRGVRVVFVLP